MTISSYKYEGKVNAIMIYSLIAISICGYVMQLHDESECMPKYDNHGVLVKKPNSLFYECRDSRVASDIK